jgi:transcriptional regulator with XRE-family HTH domain
MGMGTLEELCAKRLRMARAEANMSQEDVAAKAGISPHMLLNMESGTRPINAARIAKVAAVFGKPIEWFLSESGDVAHMRSGYRDLPPEAYEEIVDFIRAVMTKYG